MSQVLIRKLENFTALAEEEKHALLEASRDTRELSARHDIIHEGDHSPNVNLILQGFACRYKFLPDGRRQIMSYLVPGDMCDLRVFILRRMDHGLSALSDVKIAMLSAESVVYLTETFPRINQAFWWATLVEESITREWLVSVGQRTALERMAHLFCEIYYRLHAIGLTQGMNYELPVTQAELGDTLGLSTVHVNRTLQELRREGLISFRGKDVTIDDMARLQRTAMFNPGYLHLDSNSP